MSKIELTDEQRRTLAAESGKPLDVVDPATKRRYVLLAREYYECVRPLLEQAPPPRAFEPSPLIAPMMLRSMQAYWRDLPGLLKLRSRKCQWVGYHGDERVAFGRTSSDVYRECTRRGLNLGDYYVGKLEADPEGIPPWGTIECETGLYEVTDEDERELPPDDA